MRIGIFGGSFDPIHQGHLILAEHCREQAQLDEVLFVPCNRAPHKVDGASGTDRQRVETIDLAISGHPQFRRSSIEIDRGGVSYTVDTLNELVKDRPDDELFFLIGADSLDQFHTWKDPEAILSLASPLIVNRPGADKIDFQKLKSLTTPDRLVDFEKLAIGSPLIDISSSSIRHRVSQGQSIRYLVPRAIEKYIETQKMYCHA
jgi:nicotinate-nucleotide adenylyltransferase